MQGCAAAVRNAHRTGAPALLRCAWTGNPTPSRSPRPPACVRVPREAGFSRPPSVLRDGQEAQHALERCIKLARLQALLPQAGRWLGLAEAGASWQRVLAALWSQGQQRRDAIRRILAAARRQSEQLQREREEQRQRREGRHEPTLAQRQAAARAGAAAALAEERRAAAALADEESPSKAARTAAGASGVSQSPQQALRQAAAAVGEAAAEAGASGSSSRRQLWQEQGGEEDCSAQQPGEDVSSGAQQPWKEGGLTPAPQTQEPVHAVRRLWGDEEESESSQQAVPRLAGLEPEAQVRAVFAGVAGGSLFRRCWHGPALVDARKTCCTAMLPPPCTPHRRAPLPQVAAIAGLYSLLRGLQPEDQRSAEEERAWLSARTVHAHEVLEQRAWIRRHKDFCRSPDLFPEGPEVCRVGACLRWRTVLPRGCAAAAAAGPNRYRLARPALTPSCPRVPPNFHPPPARRLGAVPARAAAPGPLRLQVSWPCPKHAPLSPAALEAASAGARGGRHGPPAHLALTSSPCPSAALAPPLLSAATCWR